jgi:hypothetical protein
MSSTTGQVRVQASPLVGENEPRRGVKLCPLRRSFMMREYQDDELRDSVVIPVSVKEVVRKSCLDPGFKHRLQGRPTATLRAEGYNLPPGIEVEVLQDSDDVLHLVLPFNAISLNAELSDAELASVVGGGRKTATAKTMYS